MNQPTYTPTHPSGRTAPAFDSATMAILWVFSQHEAGWALKGFIGAN